MNKIINLKFSRIITHINALKMWAEMPPSLDSIIGRMIKCVDI